VAAGLAGSTPVPSLGGKKKKDTSGTLDGPAKILAKSGKAKNIFTRGATKIGSAGVSVHRVNQKTGQLKR